MKRMTILLLAASLLPSCVLAWNTPGEDFSGELKLGGPVTSTRNPWVWKVGEGNTQINTKAHSVLRSGEQVIPVPLPAMTVLLGKTILTTPAGREGLAPQVTYGNGTEGFALMWTAPGTASVTLPAQGQVMPAEQTPGVLQTLFDSEGPAWLREMTVSSVTGLSRFSDAALRQVDGVYGAQTVADSGELRFKGEIPSRWHTSLAVSIEYR
ncbi:fimbrial protein [Salmonella enterica subsp. enterica serovar Infantis]